MKYIESFSSITEKVESFTSKSQMENMLKKYQALLTNNNIENRKHLEDSISKMKRSLEKIDKEISDLKSKIKEGSKKIRSFGDKNPIQKDTLKTNILSWKLELRKLEGNRINESLDEGQEEEEYDGYWGFHPSEKEIKSFCDLWGQSDQEAASNLYEIDHPGFDSEDPGFSDLMIGHDYIWVEKYKVWLPENNSFYTKEDDDMIDYLKSNQ